MPRNGSLAGRYKKEYVGWYVGKCRVSLKKSVR